MSLIVGGRESNCRRPTLLSDDTLNFLFLFPFFFLFVDLLVKYLPSTDKQMNKKMSILKDHDFIE